MLKEKRVYGLDILRAFAILTVVFAHGIIIFFYKLNCCIEYH